MDQGRGSNSNILSQYHAAIEQSIRLMIQTINGTIQLHSLMFGGQSGGQIDNLHFFWKWLRPMRQMQEVEQGNQNQNHSWNFGIHWPKECCSTTWMMKEGLLLKLSAQRLDKQWRNCQMSIVTRRDHFLLANGMTKNGELQKINPEDILCNISMQ